MNESRWNVKTNTIALLIDSIQSWGQQKNVSTKNHSKNLNFFIRYSHFCWKNTSVILWVRCLQHVIYISKEYSIIFKWIFIIEWKTYISLSLICKTQNTWHRMHDKDKKVQTMVPHPSMHPLLIGILYTHIHPKQIAFPFAQRE
jgi:hypothetical protein